MFRECLRVFLFCFILIAISCSKEIEELPPTSASDFNMFYPTTIGHWVDYRLDSFSFIKSSNDTAVTKSTNVIYYREMIDDTIMGFDTPYQYKIKVYSKKQLTDNWTFYRNYSIKPTNTSIVKNEDNVRFVKLQYPISSSTEWKGNKFIDTSLSLIYGDWDYRYSDVSQPYSAGGFSFANTTTVLQYTDSNAIEKTLFFEVYAKNVGLVYAEYHDVQKQTAANPWTLPENGYIVKKTIIDWKK